jgi:carotenoid cleavage dioxygenase
MRWFRAPPSGLGHILNAFSEGEKVVVDIFVSERNQFPFIANADGAPFDRDKATPRLTRWVFDLVKPGESFESRTLYDDFMEMPAIDNRYQMHPYRHGFGAIVDRSRPLNVAGTIGVGWNTLVHVDMVNGRLERFYVGEKATCQEPCFVPRAPDAAEGDGFLLSVLTQCADEMRTELVVLDAQRIADGPVATIRMPFRLRAAVHGCWVPADAARA